MALVCDNCKYPTEREELVDGLCKQCRINEIRKERRQ